MSDEEVDELLKGFPVQYVHVNSFFSSLLRPGLFYHTVPCFQCSMVYACPRTVNRGARADNQGRSDQLPLLR